MEYFDLLIIGAGVSGVGLACTFKTQFPDKSFSILERRQNLGGTWDLFTYPGVRSDSDMLTYGYSFRPWQDAKVLADGATIRTYIAETAKAHDVDSKIRYGLKITHANWSTSKQIWMVTALQEQGGITKIFECAQLVMCTGYYNYDAGYTPEFPDISKYTGNRIHPQQWPKDIDFAGKKVVILGSGATAITLMPAIAKIAQHVTMLQRSPSYVLSVPSEDVLTERMAKILPRRWAFALARKRNTLLARWIYQACRRWPSKMRSFILKQTAKHLKGSTTDISNFSPQYMPWDQRLCIVPDADLFSALKSEKASVITDQIAGFDGKLVLLKSNPPILADVLITATGLDVQVFGGVQISVDDNLYASQRHMLYKGVLLENMPNFAWIIGYTSLSWTLKADLLSAYLCRLYGYLDEHNLKSFFPLDTNNNKTEDSIMGNLTSGYIIRANNCMPRQGKAGPWHVTNHYPSDKALLLDAPIDDGILIFTSISS